MPYRLNGVCVQVERESGWEDLKCHDNEADAQAHLTALNMNVHHAKAEFQKFDDEQQIAFGWAYTAKKGDMVVLDHSGDFVDDDALPDLEKAVYDFVVKSRAADEMHERFGGVATLVESIILTPDKMEKMGIEGDRIGWWVGFKVLDAEVWQKVKSGQYSMFSIRGRGKREVMDAD